MVLYYNRCFGPGRATTCYDRLYGFDIRHCVCDRTIDWGSPYRQSDVEVSDPRWLQDITEANFNLSRQFLHKSALWSSCSSLYCFLLSSTRRYQTCRSYSERINPTDGHPRIYIHYGCRGMLSIGVAVGWRGEELELPRYNRHTCRFRSLVHRISCY